MIKAKRILIISPEAYGAVFLSKHHYAKKLAKENKVWFLNARGHRNSIFPLVSVSDTADGIRVIDYYNFLAGFGRFFWLDRILNSILTKLILSKVGSLDLVWSFEQARFFNLKLFNASKSIFHLADYIPSHQKHKANLSRSADYVFAVSPQILDSIKTTTPKFYINHGVNCFEPRLDLKPTTNSNKTLKVCYIGNINIPYLDIDATVSAVKENASIEFHFVGPYGDSNLGKVKRNNYALLSKFPNATFHGIIPQERLLSFVNDFDLFFLAYDVVKFPIRMSNSHKLLEYLCTGKMVVSNFFPIYKEIDPSLIKMVEDLRFLPKAIEETLQEIDFYNSDEKQKARMSIAKMNSYEHQINRIAKILYAENQNG